MDAEEMFNNLGFYRGEKETNLPMLSLSIKYSDIYYTDKSFNDNYIYFNYSLKAFYVHINSLNKTTEIMKAINKQFEELGW